MWRSELVFLNFVFLLHLWENSRQVNQIQRQFNVFVNVWICICDYVNLYFTSLVGELTAGQSDTAPTRRDDCQKCRDWQRFADCLNFLLSRSTRLPRWTNKSISHRLLRLMELDLSENRQNCLKLQKNCQSQFILTWLQKYNDQRLHKYNKQRNQKCNYYTNAMIKVNIFWDGELWSVLIKFITSLGLVSRRVGVSLPFTNCITVLWDHKKYKYNWIQCK